LITARNQDIRGNSRQAIQAQQLPREERVDMQLEETVLDAGGARCPFTAARPAGDAWASAILLHGYSFTRSVWFETGVAQGLAENGVEALAPDMPYGRSSGCARRSRSYQLNATVLAAVASRRSMPRYAIVAASMGARYAAIYTVSTPEPPRLLVLVAPSLGKGEAGEEARRALHEAAKHGVAITVYAGRRDRLVPLHTLATLAEELGAKLRIFEAGHVIHRDDPRGFLEALIEDLRGTLQAGYPRPPGGVSRAG